MKCKLFKVCLTKNCETCIFNPNHKNNFVLSDSTGKKIIGCYDAEFGDNMFCKDCCLYNIKLEDINSCIEIREQNGSITFYKGQKKELQKLIDD